MACLQLVTDAALSEPQDPPVRKRMVGKVGPFGPRLDPNLIKRLPRLGRQWFHQL